MNIIAKLPSGKILDMSRFVALVPINDASQAQYELILEGYPYGIPIESQDIAIVKRVLETKNNHKIYSKEILRQNQEALQNLKNRMIKNQNMSEEESLQREEFFTEFKQIIDRERTSQRKLYE